jgi:predicted PurR-regulated permease PerM
MNDARLTRITNETFIRGILLIFGAYLAFRLRDILLLIIVSIVIASFVEAGVQLFARYRVQRILSVPIIFAFVVFFILAIFYAFIPVVFRELSGMITLLMTYLPTGDTTINTQSIEGATQFVNTLTQHASLNDLLISVKSATLMLSQGATSVIGSTFGGLLRAILVIVMSFYLSIQERGIETFLRILTPPKHEKYVVDLWNRTQRKIGLWFKGQLVLGFIIGAITFVVLALMGVQYAFLIGLVTGVAELIPFGIIFAAVPAILFAVIDGGVLLGVKVLIFFIIIQQIENYILSPVVARRIVGIPPLVVLLAFLMGITLAGFWGAIIAMPVAVFVLEYMGDIEKRKLIPIVPNE